MDELTEIRHRPDLDTNFTKRIRVVTERVITNKRRLDISVEIPGSENQMVRIVSPSKTSPMPTTSLTRSRTTSRFSNGSTLTGFC